MGKANILKTLGLLEIMQIVLCPWLTSTLTLDYSKPSRSIQYL